MRFVGLEPGEEPGDPELGGWRPFKIAMLPGFTVATGEIERLRHTRNRSISLQQALKVLAYSLNYALLSNAIATVNQRLLIKGGGCGDAMTAH